MVQSLVEDTGADAAPAGLRRYASSRLRVLDLGTVPWLQSQSVHHGIAHAFGPDTPDTLVIVRPDRPYLCVGRHALGAPLSRSAVARSGLPLVRRALGGGTVLITPDQTFFVFVVHRRRLPLPDPGAMVWCLGAGAAAYRALGVDAHVDGTTDLHSSGGPTSAGGAGARRKLCGSGSATVGDAAVFGGNVIVDFDPDRFLELLQYPTRVTREVVAEEMRAQMGSVRTCGGGSPSAEEVSAAVRRGVQAACGVELVPGELTREEIASARRSEAWLRRVPQAPERTTRVWWKVRSGSGVLRAVLTRPRHAAMLLVVRDRIVSRVVADVPADAALVESVSRALTGRPLDEPPDAATWAACGLPSDGAYELSGWLRIAAHTVT
jgi:lipoate-protein ligase A